MNRFVSLLLVGLSLAAISLAQPAQAQWSKGQPYYDSHNTQTASPNTIIVTTPVGAIDILSTTSSTPTGYFASGSYSGNVNVDCTWAGAPAAQRTDFSAPMSFSATGHVSGNGSGYASSSTGNSQVAASGHVSSPGSYNNTNSTSFVFIPQPGDTTTTVVTYVCSLGGSTSATNPSTAEAAATITFGSLIQ